MIKPLQHGRMFELGTKSICHLFLCEGKFFFQGICLFSEMQINIYNFCIHCLDVSQDCKIGLYGKIARLGYE
jgi:hypothetical protein